MNKKTAYSIWCSTVSFLSYGYANMQHGEFALRYERKGHISRLVLFPWMSVLRWIFLKLFYLCQKVHFQIITLVWWLNMLHWYIGRQQHRQWNTWLSEQMFVLQMEANSCAVAGQSDNLLLVTALTDLFFCFFFPLSKGPTGIYSVFTWRPEVYAKKYLWFKVDLKTNPWILVVSILY